MTRRAICAPSEAAARGSPRARRPVVERRRDRRRARARSSASPRRAQEHVLDVEIVVPRARPRESPQTSVGGGAHGADARSAASPDMSAADRSTLSGTSRVTTSARSKAGRRGIDRVGEQRRRRDAGVAAAAATLRSSSGARVGDRKRSRVSGASSPPCRLCRMTTRSPSPGSGTAYAMPRPASGSRVGVTRARSRTACRREPTVAQRESASDASAHTTSTPPTVNADVARRNGVARRRISRRRRDTRSPAGSCS